MLRFFFELAEDSSARLCGESLPDKLFDVDSLQEKFEKEPFK